MPIWITPRRLGASAALYAVFVFGWHLGQPLPDVGCATESATASDEPVELGEPGDVTSDLYGTAQQLVTYDFVSTATILSCEPGTARPRLLAWVTGDWR
ncbi:hypothetical protein [Streptomyces zagrosensis]|uniref:Uncharacterized protein n=1 Tax=Streptomyces zagrosensis TaxID=1042984 RepID=A0A7W9Q6M5_9ACTN|nr:hypothetical protein [Streptomyces zagrosensis]MBB5933687.1 hypothetical protein [Streptomyces zagrosensis]